MSQSQPNKDTAKLLKMKEQIEEKKISKAQKEGERNTILKTLSETFGCADRQQVVRKMDHLDRQIEKKEEEFAVEVDKLDKDFPWEG